MDSQTLNENLMRKLARELSAREQAEKCLEDISQTLYGQAHEKDRLLQALQESQERYRVSNESLMRKLARELSAREQAEKYLEDISQTLYEQAHEKDRLLQALQESQERYRVLVDHIPEAILIEVRGQIAFANRAAYDLLGISEEEGLSEYSTIHFIVPEFKEHAATQMAQVLLDLGRLICEEAIVGVDGHLVDVETERIGLIYQHEPAVQVVMRQIGERKVLAQERLNHSLAVQHNQTLQALNEHKSNFIANMSHEIRTPMNGVVSMVELLATTPLSKEQTEFVDVLQFSSRALLHIINQVLDLSQLEAGKLVIEPTVFEPLVLVESCVKLFTGYAARKQLTLSFEIEPDVPTSLSGDPARLGQVLLNLIGNALKFTQVGRVHVSLKVQEFQKNQVKVAFTVTDTGVGIAPEQLPMLFQRYEQLGGKLSQRLGGTGLGLQICKELMLVMGGDIQVQSTLGKGSVFECTLFLETNHGGTSLDDWTAQLRAPLLDQQDLSWTQPPIETKVQSGQRDDRHRILLVEDNPINQLIVQKLLPNDHFELVCVNNGVLGIQTWQKADFDLILMDIWMPEMDGLVTTQRIRDMEMSQYKKRTPIVALTANTLETDKQQAMAVGMDDYLQKPIRLIDLKRVLNDWLPKLD